MTQDTPIGCVITTVLFPFTDFVPYTQWPPIHQLLRVHIRQCNTRGTYPMETFLEHKPPMATRHERITLYLMRMRTFREGRIPSSSSPPRFRRLLRCPQPLHYCVGWRRSGQCTAAWLTPAAMMRCGGCSLAQREAAAKWSGTRLVSSSVHI